MDNGIMLQMVRRQNKGTDYISPFLGGPSGWKANTCSAQSIKILDHWAHGRTRYTKTWNGSRN